MIPTVSIIILNWNGWKDTISCLESLVQISNVRFEVIIIDNASLDDSVDNLIKWINLHNIPLFQFTEPNTKQITTPSKETTSGIQCIILFNLPENIGFCAGNNLGLRQAQDNGIPYAVMLNNDTLVEPDFLLPLVEYAESNPSIGLLGCQICYADDKDLVWWAGGKFNSYLGSNRSYDRESRNQVPTKPYRTEWVSGCMTFMPLRIFEKIGGYDERFFIWCEEWDLSLRIDRAGYEMAVIPKSVIYHKVGKSLGLVSPLTYYYPFRNLLLLRSQYLPRWKWVCFFILYVPYKFLQMLYYVMKLGWSFWPAYWDSISDYVFKRFGKWRRHYERRYI